ncbi:MAG: hypothetical protein R3F33_06035 [Planctomycetota bacterium]
MKLFSPLLTVVALTPLVQAQVQLSEVRAASAPEYVELQGTPGQSLNGIWYLNIGFGAGSGTVRSAVDLTGAQIGPNGYLSIGRSDYIYGDLGFEVLGSNFLDIHDNITLTHVLVSNFTGTLGSNLDPDNNGILENPPWTALIDSVAVLSDSTISSWPYSPTQVPAVAGAEAHLVYRCGSTWQAGPNNPLAGLGTPGYPNPCAGVQSISFCDPAFNNSTGQPASMVGTPSGAAGSGLHLEVTQGPPGEFGYFLVSDSYWYGAGVNLGDGKLCIGLSNSCHLGRYNVVGQWNSLGQFNSGGVFANLGGTSSAGTGFDVPAQLPFGTGSSIGAGQGYQFQFWYRDTPSGVGHSNLSNGMTWFF